LNYSKYLVCLTGAGNYYCSGNDLTNFTTKEAMANIKQAAVDGGLLLEYDINSINCLILKLNLILN
jgi:enoyl-CoA hydratase/carnithine racemase